MANTVEEWRLPEKRRMIIQKLEEAYSAYPGNLPNGIQQSPQELEKVIYDKSKKGEEYNHFLQQLLLRLARGSVRRPGQMQQQQPGGIPQQIGGQTPGNMMNSGGINMQPNQMGMNSSAPGYNPSQYQQYPGGMHPSSIPGNDMGMGGIPQNPQPPQYNHPVYRNVAPRPNQHPMRQQLYPQQQMMQQGGYNTHMNSGGIPPRFNVHPSMIQSLGIRGQMPPMQHKPIGGQGNPGSIGMGIASSGMGAPAPVQAQSSSGFGSVHSVQAISNPSFSTAQTVSSPAMGSGMQPSPRPVMSESNVPLSSGPLTNTGNEQTGVKGQQNGPGANPSTPHAAPMQGSVPSPAPPTPLLPASPATSGVGSPAQQPSITPEENEVYMRKLAELQKYTPLLQKWITRMNKDDKNNQLTKLRSLHNLLTNSNKRVPITTLMRCGEALDKMFSNDQISREHHSSVSSESGLTHPRPTLPIATPPQPHNEPVVPPTKLIEPRHSPSLHEFKMIPSPPSSCGSLMETIQAKPLPAERLPPAKRMCNRDEPTISPGLMRELAHISNVKVEKVPKQNRFDKSTTLKCSLDDDGLSPVPPLTIRIPSDYPLVSPICDLSHYHVSTNSTLITEVGKLLSERLSRSFNNYSLSSLLADWEMCVLRAMATQLLDNDISL